MTPDLTRDVNANLKTYEGPVTHRIRRQWVQGTPIIEVVPRRGIRKKYALDAVVAAYAVDFLDRHRNTLEPGLHIMALLQRIRPANPGRAVELFRFFANRSADAAAQAKRERLLAEAQATAREKGQQAIRSYDQTVRYAERQAGRIRSAAEAEREAAERLKVRNTEILEDTKSLKQTLEERIAHLEVRDRPYQGWKRDRADVLLLVEGGECLSACSHLLKEVEYFKKLLACEEMKAEEVALRTAAGEQHQYRTLDLGIFSKDTVYCFLKWMDNPGLLAAIGDRGVLLEIYRFADYVQETELADDVMDLWVNGSTPEDLVAFLCSDFPLLSAVVDEAALRIERMSRTVGYSKIPQEHLLKIFANEVVGAADETALFGCLKRWVEGQGPDYGSLEQHLELLEPLRVDLIRKKEGLPKDLESVPTEAPSRIFVEQLSDDSQIVRWIVPEVKKRLNRDSAVIESSSFWHQGRWFKIRFAPNNPGRGTRMVGLTLEKTSDEDSVKLPMKVQLQNKTTRISDSQVKVDKTTGLGLSANQIQVPSHGIGTVVVTMKSII